MGFEPENPYTQQLNDTPNYKLLQSSKRLKDKAKKEQPVETFYDLVTKISKPLYACSVKMIEVHAFKNEPWQYSSILKSINFILDELIPQMEIYRQFLEEKQHELNVLFFISAKSPLVLEYRRLRKNVRDTFRRYPKFPTEKGRYTGGY